MEVKMLVNLILWIIFGGIAGWIASMIMNRDGQMWAVANIVVGIIGAVVGGFLFNLVGLSGDTGFNLWTLLVSVVGAVVLLALIGMVNRAAEQDHFIEIPRLLCNSYKGASCLNTHSFKPERIL